MDEEDCHAHWHHAPLGTIYGGVAPKFLSVLSTLQPPSSLSSFLPTFPNTLATIFTPSHSHSSLTSHTPRPHTYTHSLTSHNLHTLTPTLTSLATIHQRISWSPWQLLPVQSWARRPVRPDMMRCSHTERQLQRRRIGLMKYAAPEIYNPPLGKCATLWKCTDAPPYVLLPVNKFLAPQEMYSPLKSLVKLALFPHPPFSHPTICSFSLASSERSSSSTGTRKEAGAHPITPPASTIHQPAARRRGKGKGAAKGKGRSERNWLI